MTNTALLKRKITESGYKMSYIANRLGISRQALAKKMHNHTEFRSSEIRGLCEILNIDAEEMRLIFFTHNVD